MFLQDLEPTQRILDEEGDYLGIFSPVDEVAEERLEVADLAVELLPVHRAGSMNADRGDAPTEHFARCSFPHADVILGHGPTWLGLDADVKLLL